jgi:hypothetical protein
LGDGDPADYYLIDPAIGHFKIFVSTEGLNSSPVTRGSFKIEIVDEFDQSWMSDHVISPDINTQQISWNAGSDEGKFYLKITGSSNFNYHASMYPANAGPPLVMADDPVTGERREDWRLVTTDGFSGGVGGAFGQVFGTKGFQAISVLGTPGSISFDPSFNRGGDIVSLPGDAIQWRGTEQGSSAGIGTDLRTSVRIPAGPSGLFLNFDDGVRLLRIEEYGDVRQVMIGHSGLTDDVVTWIVSPAQDLELPDAYDPNAVARLFVADAATVVAQGNLEVFGTGVGQEIMLRPSVARLDPSFNRGGDALFLEGNLSEFEASVFGSNVLLEGAGYSVEIPVGIAGMELVFSDAAATLFYDVQAGSVFIGNKMIGEVAAFLSFG